MARGLFESFLQDPEQYRAAEQYWEALAADVAESVNQANEWPRWCPLGYADGRPSPRRCAEIGAETTPEDMKDFIDETLPLPFDERE